MCNWERHFGISKVQLFKMEKTDIFYIEPVTLITSQTIERDNSAVSAILVLTGRV